jgi:FAD/FMN-containing dehydrogenase
MLQPVASWGRLNHDLHHVVHLTDRTQLPAYLSNTRPGVAFGMGRSYGDVCLNAGHILWNTRALDRFIAFDAQTGRLRCEAGVTLETIQRTLAPTGWLLPVTPGTQHVTVGGAIANDVHGKNHHEQGSFGHHVCAIKLLRTAGEWLDCSPTQHPDWFAATVGGLGLTGVIVEAELQLRPISSVYLHTDTIPFTDLHSFFNLTDYHTQTSEYTVAWIDCLAKRQVRGLFMHANHAATGEYTLPTKRQLTFPLTPPLSLVNRATLRPFNTLYYHLKARAAGARLEDYESFFYPLDRIAGWNRLYGRRGFFQYQSVVPQNVGFDATQAMLAEIARSGSGSCLAVLKTFGARHAPGLLSFPQPGVTLALDFPNQGQRTIALFNRLDAIVQQAGGRLYCAKNALMSAELFAAGYPRLNEFLTYRDPGISSGLSRRLLGS